MPPLERTSLSRQGSVDPASILQVLEAGSVKLRGLMPDCSNYTYLAHVRWEEQETLAIYKPVEGETPLDDFPSGTLSKREVAAYLVDAALGWQIVPPTVFRQQAPLGPGSLQAFITADFSQHYFTLMPKHAPAFRVMAAFDCIVNNADRKSGHCLLDGSGHVWGVDNGLSFHPLPKLRTVIWEFGGEPIPGPLRRDADRLAKDLTQGAAWVPAVQELLSPAELRVLGQRARRVGQQGVYPVANSRWAYPWPLI